MSDPKAETLGRILAEWQERHSIGKPRMLPEKLRYIREPELTDLQSRSYDAGWEAGIEAARKQLRQGSWTDPYTDREL